MTALTITIMRVATIVFVALFSFFVQTTIHAHEIKSTGIEQLLICKAMINSAQRLACYDQGLDDLGVTVLKSEIITSIDDAPVQSKIEQNELKVELNELKIELNELKQKTATIEKQSANYSKNTVIVNQQNTAGDSDYQLLSASKDARGLWKFYFENKQVWRQNEVRYVPRVKQFPVTAHITKGAFSSFRLRIDNIDKTIKVKRVK